MRISGYATTYIPQKLKPTISEIFSEPHAHKDPESIQKNSKKADFSLKCKFQNYVFVLL